MSPFRNQRFAYFDSDPGNDGFRGDVALCDVDSDQMSNRTERGGMIVATLATTIGLFLLVLWSVNQSSFERCSALENLDARIACYEAVRQQEMASPAKGAKAPPIFSHSGE